MKIYLAGSCGSEDRTLMKRIAQFLRKREVEVYCPFELQIPNAWDLTQEEWARKVFEADIKAIKDCDYMVSISKGRESTAGTNWEQGYAFALGKSICVFQITNKPTSLMTFWGCDGFVNSSVERIFDDLQKYVIENKKCSYVCKTVLT